MGYHVRYIRWLLRPYPVLLVTQLLSQPTSSVALLDAKSGVSDDASSCGQGCWLTWCSNMGYHRRNSYTKRFTYPLMLSFVDYRLQADFLVGRVPKVDK